MLLNYKQKNFLLSKGAFEILCLPVAERLVHKTNKSNAGGSLVLLAGRPDHTRLLQGEIARWERGQTKLHSSPLRAPTMHTVTSVVTSFKTLRHGPGVHLGRRACFSKELITYWACEAIF